MPRRDRRGRAGSGDDAAALAEALLADLADVEARAAELEAAAASEMAAVRERYREAADLRERARDIDRRLLNLMKSRREEIFRGRDKVRVAGGVLHMGEARRVTVPRGALERVKRLGWRDGVRVSESLNRGVIETWSDSRLAAIGARRLSTVRFSYQALGRGA